MASILNKSTNTTIPPPPPPPVASNQLAVVPYGAQHHQHHQHHQHQLHQQQVGLIAHPETIVHQPIVQESLRQDRVIEVQPIIHRDVERQVVNHIERHITEPAPLSRAVNVHHQPIVQESFHDHVINEVQPIIHREIAIPQVEQIQQHYLERVIAAPQHSHQVIYEEIPHQLGQQFIQHGLGTQQYLRSGLVDRGYGSSYPHLVGQQAYIIQQQHAAPPIVFGPRGHISRDLLNLRHGNSYSTGSQIAPIGGGYNRSVYGTGIGGGIPLQYQQPLVSNGVGAQTLVSNQSLHGGQTGVYPRTSALVNPPLLHNQYGSGYSSLY